MAFLLRNTKLVYNLAGLTGQSSHLGNRLKRVSFLQRKNVFNFKDFRARTKASLAQVETESEQRNPDLNRKIYNLNLEINRRNVWMKDLQSVFKEVKRIGVMTNYELMVLLKCCTQVTFTSSEKERLEMAENIWKLAESLGVELNITHYNALLDVYLDNNQVFSPTEFLSTLEKGNLTPNVHTIRRILKAYCQQGDLKGASDMLNKMKEMDYKLNELDFNALIMGYSNTGELDKAEEIIKVMESKNVEPSAQTYVNLLCGYAKHGLIDKLNDTIKELPSREIFLSDADILEIMFALSVNNYGDKIDILLQEFARSSESDELIGKFLPRLLHRRLDSVALRLLKEIDTSKQFQNSLLISQFILDHFVLYRTPKETIEMCDVLEKSGLARVPLSYALKTVFLTKDEEYSLKFFNVMRENNIEVRKHYYWPGIIKAAKKGNSHLLSHLEKLPTNVLNNPKTITDFVIPNYEFGNDWQNDLSSLEKAGLRKAIVAREIAVNLLYKKQFDDFLHLVRSNPIFPSRTNHIFHLLSDFIRKDPEKVEQTVDAVDYLAHDYYKYKNIFVETVDITDFFSGALISLLKVEQEEKTVERLLEKMLDKKMKISMAAKEQVTNLYTGQRVQDLVEMLTQPGLNFEKDPSLLSMKNSYDFKISQSQIGRDKESLFYVLSELLRFIAEEKFDDALRICEFLYSQGKGFISDESNKFTFEKKFRQCFLESAKRGNFKLTEKLFEVGVSLGLLRSNDFVPVVRSLLKSNDIPQAIDRYCEFVLHHGNLSGCIEILSQLVQLENVEGCQKIVDLVTDIRNKNTGLSVLVCAFLRANSFDKAKKVLETPGFTFSNKVVQSFCIQESKMKDSEFMEKFVEIVQGLNYFQGQWMYRILAEKYVTEGRVDKLVELWPKLPKEEILDQNFLEQYEHFVKDPSVERLNVFNFSIPRVGWDRPEGLANEFKTTEKQIKSEEKTDNSIDFKAQVLARKGEIPELIDLIKAHPDKVQVRRIAAIIFNRDDVEKYFKLIESFKEEDQLDKIKLILYPSKLIPYFNNDEYFSKYKSFAVECLNKGIVEPFLFSLIICLISKNMQAGIQMLEENSSRFNLNEVTSLKIRKVLRVTNTSVSKFLDIVLSDEKLKQNFSSLLPNFYSTVLNHSCKVNDIESIVEYSKMAKSDGSWDLIKNEELKEELNKKLKEQNISL